MSIFIKEKEYKMKKILSLILVLTLALGMLSSCNDSKEETIGTGACEYRETYDTAGHELKYVLMTVKNHGSLVLLLDATNTPVTVANFMKLVNEGFYDGLTFHRVIENFMIQGGDPKADGTGGSDEDIYGEFIYNGHWNNISHKYGVISMARANPYDSASSQFFICNADASRSLDYKYAAFGYVIAGLSVVDSVTAATAGYGDSNGGISDKSLQAVIESVVEITEEEAMKYVELSKAKEGK